MESAGGGIGEVGVDGGAEVEAQEEGGEAEEVVGEEEGKVGVVGEVGVDGEGEVGVDKAVEGHHGGRATATTTALTCLWNPSTLQYHLWPMRWHVPSPRGTATCQTHPTPPPRASLTFCLTLRPS